MDITYIAHSCVMVEMSGFTFITDPVLRSRIAFGLKASKHPQTKKAQELPNIDAVLISHGHYDHLDVPSIKAISTNPGKPVIVLPKDWKKTGKQAGFSDVRELSPGESAEVKGVRITATPAHHFTARLPLHFWGVDYQGYVVQGEKTVYFSGDTGLKNNFKEIGEQFRIDAAILPIGAYSPESFREHHLSPEDAIEAMKLLNARIMIPVHWGTFKLSWEPMSEPIERLTRAAEDGGLSDSVVIINHGEKIEI